MSTEKFKYLSRSDFIKLTSYGLLTGLPGIQLLNNIYKYGTPFFSGSLNAAGRPDILLPGGGAKSTVFLYLQGGMSHIDSFDPKTGNGPFQTITSSLKGAKVTELMPLTAKELHRVNLIRSVHSTEGNHDRANHLLHTARTPMAAFRDIPSMGAVMAYAKQQSGPYFPGHIVIGPSAYIAGSGGFLGHQCAAYQLNDLRNPLSGMKPKFGRPDNARMLRREMILETLNNSFRNKTDGEALRHFREIAASALDFMNSDKLQVMDLASEPQSARERYGETWIGRALLLARRLAEAGIPFIEIIYGGWDTHQDNKAKMRQLWKDLDPALAAFLGETGSSGLLKEIVFFMSGEFGRTPEMAPNGDGRDHHPAAWSVLLGGARLGSGNLIGETDSSGNKVLQDPVTVPDLLTAIYRASGVKPDAVLKNSEGRPFKPVDEPKGIPGLL